MQMARKAAKAKRRGHESTSSSSLPRDKAISCTAFFYSRTCVVHVDCRQRGQSGEQTRGPGAMRKKKGLRCDAVLRCQLHGALLCSRAVLRCTVNWSMSLHPR